MSSQTAIASAREKGAIPQLSFFLTPRTLEGLFASKKAVSPTFESTKALLKQAEENIFVPFLSRTIGSGDFERFAYQFSPIRLFALVSILQELGIVEFETRYLSTFSKAFAEIADKSEAWGLSQSQLEEILQRYIAAAVRASLALSENRSLDATLLMSLLKAATETDFGLTAIMLALDGTIPSRPEIVQDVLDRTAQAVNEYSRLVNHLLHPSVSSEQPLSGSLKAHGDLDKSLRELRAAWGAMLEKPKKAQ